MPATDRSFRVHADHDAGHRPRVLHEPSFEAAALAYVEEWPHVEAAGEVRIIVRDLEDGHEHCFRVDVGSGETSDCG